MLLVDELYDLGWRILYILFHAFSIIVRKLKRSIGNILFAFILSTNQGKIYIGVSW